MSKLFSLLTSEKGYSAVSIRDICRQVQIKESSVYYHFKNKQAIFDELISRFQKYAESLLWIEQFHNAQVKEVYDYWIFTKPLSIQSEIFEMLVRMGILCRADGKYLAVKYYAPIFFFAQKWLFSGKLTDESKNVFRTDAYQYIQWCFAEIAGTRNG